MDSTTVNKNLPKMKATKNGSFSNVALNKSDVGDFHEGYFVMVDVKETRLPHNRNKNLPQRQNDSSHNRPTHQRERSPKDFHHSRPDGDSNVSTARLSSPSTSPTKNGRHLLNSQPAHSDNYHAPLSPHKPRKAHHERRVDLPESLSLDSGSPPKNKGPSPPKEKGPSPPSTRWAGPAFSNAPPPSSLPLPDFPPFTPQISPPASPPPSPPQQQAPLPQYTPQTPTTYVYYEPSYFYPPVYTQAPPPSSFTSLPYVVPPPSLDQLSMGLRRMLHINEVPPMTA